MTTERAQPGLTGSWGIASIIGLLALLVGTVSGRSDLAALAAPFIFLAVTGLQNRRTRTDVTAAVDEAKHNDDGVRRIALRLHTDHAMGIAVVRTPGCRPTGIAADFGSETPRILAEQPLSGRSVVLTYSYADLDYFGMRAQPPIAASPVTLSILPSVSPLTSLPLPRRLRGLTGEHTSRLPGTGSELRGLHAFQPGDELRRIDAKATARASTDQDRLIVRGTFAEAEATITLVLDTASDYPASALNWFDGQQPRLSIPTSLHHARQGAATVAASYLARGDRVGLTELSGLSHPLRASAGRRQLELIRARLAQFHPIPRYERSGRDLQIPSGSLVLLFSPFMDEGPLRHLLRWHQSGHHVLGVDTLPNLDARSLDANQQAALRLALLGRTATLRRLTQTGIAVLNGTEPGQGADPQNGQNSLRQLHGLHHLHGPAQLDLSSGLAVAHRVFSGAGTGVMQRSSP